MKGKTPEVGKLPGRETGGWQSKANTKRWIWQGAREKENKTQVSKKLTRLKKNKKQRDKNKISVIAAKRPSCLLANGGRMLANVIVCSIKQTTWWMKAQLIDRIF